MSSTRSLAEQALNQGNGILRLSPTWVPRSFCVPGRRIKLHPDDYYALGGNRGGIDERWFASTIEADNGPLTSVNEGLSHVVVEDRAAVTLRDVIAELGGAIIGRRLWDEYGAWPMYSKFFDNRDALPFHIHQSDEKMAWKGVRGKPEAYYFPPQVNNHGGSFPFTFFALEPGTTKDQLRERLEYFTKGDNQITALSRAYKLQVGTGWYIPAGVLHAPGSMCTYEPQRASDVYAMFESVVDGRALDEDSLWKDCPPDKRGDFDYLISLVDWDVNTDPEFASKFSMRPKTKAEDAGFVEKWVVYLSDAFSASELTVAPGATVTVRDRACYGFIAMQGHGTFGDHVVESPAVIRYGQLTYDEYFVTEDAGQAGVTITNPSPSDPLVLLKHFGPGNPDLA